MSNVETFQHDGETYEVRTTQDGHLTRVRVFLKGKPANGYEYTVDTTTLHDARISDLPLDLPRQMIDSAINDVRQGYWEQYVAAVQLLRAQRF